MSCGFVPTDMGFATFTGETDTKIEASINNAVAIPAILKSSVLSCIFYTLNNTEWGFTPRSGPAQWV